MLENYKKMMFCQKKKTKQTQIVVWSSKISLKLVKLSFHFSNQLYAPFSELHFVENPIEIGQLVSKIWRVEGFHKQ